MERVYREKRKEVLRRRSWEGDSEGEGVRWKVGEDS